MFNEDWDASPYVPQGVPQEQYVASAHFTSSNRSNNFPFNGAPGGGNWRDGNDRNRGGDQRRSRNFDNRREPRNFNQNRGDNRNRFEQNGEAVTIKVPSRFVGRIIGKGGSKINDLQFESQAKIQVTKDCDGDDTIIKLYGDESAVSRAKELISDLTVDRERPNHFHSTNYESNSKVQQTPAPDNGEEKKIIDWQAYFQECEEKEKAEWDQLPPIKKFFYEEHPEVTRLTEEQVEQFRLENNNIVVDRTFKKTDSKPIPKPCITFEHAFHNYPEILEEIRKAGFEKPSPIQSQAWPVLLKGEDLIGIAQTGTGKTLAFLLPALIHIDGQPSTREERDGPLVLVMAPTRELALQIDKEVKKYQYKGVNAVCIYGGGNRREQVNTVTKGVDIVIATPGRLNDLVQAGYLNVKSVTYVVLDEADRMLDMGFEPQIRKIMYMIRPTRQTVMTSATWPPGVRRLADSYMDDPVQVYVGTLDLAATHTVSQLIRLLEDKDEEKMNALLEIVQNLTPDEKVIIFCGKKSRADDLASELSIMGISCQTMHGDREQSDREQALLDIADGTVQILIATDVASRGLDIVDITHVINYDFPRNIEEYVHRVGRTGRAGKTGQSISFFTRADWAQAKELIAILEEAVQYVPEELYSMAERHDAWKERKEADRAANRGRGGGYGYRDGGGRNRRW